MRSCQLLGCAACTLTLTTGQDFDHVGWPLPRRFYAGLLHHRLHFLLVAGMGTGGMDFFEYLAMFLLKFASALVPIQEPRGWRMAALP